MVKRLDILEWTNSSGFRAEEARWVLGRLLKGRRDLNKAFVTHIREQ